MLRPMLALAGLVTLAAGVAGCGAQDEVVGEGPASLVFSNSGAETIDVSVRWTDDEGTPRRKGFDLEPQGRVEVRLADQLEYRIYLDAECGSTTAAEEGPPEPRVITVGGD
ncbi:MAG: hypothetical protein FJX74_02690 [Armatimonadetes bacterium]|nr:hypothetical protein [Armatimonadota bacterium]